jgi:cytochrome P450
VQWLPELEILMTTAQQVLNFPPRVRGVPVLGVLPQVWKNTLDFFLQSALTYGDVVRIDMGPRRMFLVSHPDQVKYVLQDNNKNYVKGYEMVKPLMGEGLVTSDGDLWRRQRRLIQPLFNRPNMASLFPIMAETTQETIAGWKNRPNPDEPLDLASEMMLLTQTIILRTMFSADMGQRSREISSYFASALEYMNSLLMAPSPIFHKLPTPTNRRFKAALQQLDAVVYQFITDRRQKGSHDRRDLLAVLMEAKDVETGQGMSDKQIRDELITIFLAGHETTATLLAWTWLLLGRNPAEAARVQSEIDKLLGGRVPTVEDISQLVYTRQVLDESLRLYPPAWMFARRLVGDDEIGGYHVAAGSMVMLSPYVTHRLPAFWNEPEKFDPTRFTPEAVSSRNRYAYFPFGGGPRLCIGMPFTQQEAPLLLAMIMQNFQVDLVPGQEVKPTPLATLRPRPAIWARLKAR